MKKTLYILLLIVVLGVASCSVKYGFQGGSVDYNKYSSISIKDFPNNAELVNPNLSQTFTEELRDKFTRQTKLKVISSNGDMQIEGEIVSYFLTAMAISANTYASETKLSLGINVRFVDTKNPANDFEKRYTTFRMFDSAQMLTDVEADLVDEMVKEIVNNIFNETAAKW